MRSVLSHGISTGNFLENRTLTSQHNQINEIKVSVHVFQVKFGSHLEYSKRAVHHGME
jgi:hypothetical protein